MSRSYGQHDADDPILLRHRLHSRLAHNPQLYKICVCERQITHGFRCGACIAPVMPLRPGLQWTGQKLHASFPFTKRKTKHRFIRSRA